MTELYSISIVAEYAFTKSCEATESIHLVGSASCLISSVSFPILQSDAPDNALDTNNVQQSRNVTPIQKLMENHLSRVRALCKTLQQDMQALEEGSVPRQFRSKLLREMQKV